MEGSILASRVNRRLLNIRHLSRVHSIPCERLEPEGPVLYAGRAGVDTRDRIVIFRGTRASVVFLAYKEEIEYSRRLRRPLEAQLGVSGVAEARACALTSELAYSEKARAAWWAHDVSC